MVLGDYGICVWNHDWQFLERRNLAFAAKSVVDVAISFVLPEVREIASRAGFGSAFQFPGAGAKVPSVQGPDFLAVFQRGTAHGNFVCPHYASFSSECPRLPFIASFRLRNGSGLLY